MLEVLPLPEGRVRIHRVQEFTFRDRVRNMLRERIPDPAAGYRPHGWTPLTDFVPNAILYEWGAVVGNLLAKKGQQYGIGGMYIEFENVADPDDAVVEPDFSRDADQGIDYYNDLGESPDRDYLRVPLIAAYLQSSDETKYPKGNEVVFFAQTSGVEGVHGKPFSDADNSKAFGGALVAFVDEADHTRDLVLSRFYLDSGSQQVKLPTSQIGYEWRLRLK